MISGTTYPSDDPELVAVEADYAAKEAALQAEIDNIESSHPGYDEYRYDLDTVSYTHLDVYKRQIYPPQPPRWGHRRTKRTISNQNNEKGGRPESASKGRFRHSSM